MPTNCVLQLVLLLSTAVLLDAGELTWKKWNPRIVNGARIDIKKAPWQISLIVNGTHSCGGAIYNEYIIITAAHCLTWKTNEPLPVRTLLVRAGSTKWKSGGQEVPVKQFKIHENNNSSTSTDIAILQLAQPLTFGDSVKAIPLASKSPKNGADSFVSGWGYLEHNFEVIQSVLHGVTLPIVDREHCAHETEYLPTNITEDMICAGGQDKGACHGDSGGPLVSNNQLVGIVSWGINCSMPGYPSVFANVAYFHEWLMDNIGKMMQTN